MKRRPAVATAMTAFALAIVAAAQDAPPNVVGRWQMNGTLNDSSGNEAHGWC